MTEKEQGAGFGLGLLIGTAVGLAFGFLYAPQAGKETRAKLMEKVEGAKNKAEEIAGEAKERASKIVEEAKTKASEMRRGRTEGPELTSQYPTQESRV